MKKRLITAAMALLSLSATAQTLVHGGQFMDRIQPLEGSVLSADVWGAPGVRPRLVDNGIEDATFSYWGGNIVRDNDGKYHLNIAGWPESSRNGHATWSSGSMVYHATADNVYGPYTNTATIGTGHNAETYRTKDGTWVIYIIGGRYTSTSLEGPWTLGTYTFDKRGRTLIAGDDEKVSLSNCTFAQRQDGSMLMMDRGGGVWISRDGLNDPWHQLTDATVYSGNRRHFEDPVVWRDSLQYHMIVNDWNARVAYYSRSIDGLHWVTEAGTAYMPGVARHKDGRVEEWYKYERPKVYLDESGRAAYFNLAVIDTIKSFDKASDHHSSKNIIMPLNKGLVMEVLNSGPVSASTTEIRVIVRAEKGFNPQEDLDIESLRFGSHGKVNYGNGFKATATEAQGDDLIITFTGAAGASGITEADFAPKMLGRSKAGEMVYGYAKMPCINYRPAILSAMMPTVDDTNMAGEVLVENFGLSASGTMTVQVIDNKNAVVAEGTANPIETYGKATVTLTPKRAIAQGTTKLIVVFRQGNKETDRNTFSTESIAANQQTLKELNDSITTLLSDEAYTEGRQALKTAQEEQEKYLTLFSLEKTAAAIAALKKAIRNFMFANGNVVETYDFYSWAMTANAALHMTGSNVTVTDGATTATVPVADRVSDGITTQYFNGRIAFNYGSSNFNLRNKGVNNNSSGLFDFNKDSYFSILNLNPGDEVTIRVTGESAYFVSTNAYLQSDATKAEVKNGDKVTSDATYIITGTEGTKTHLDLKGVHYTTIKLVNVKTNEKERISAPTVKVTGAAYSRRTITIVPGVGTAGTEAEMTYYTTDGSEPTANSAAYTKPFSISETTTVKAVSSLPDGTMSDVCTVECEAGTTLSLNTPVIVLEKLEGDSNTPVVDVQCDNSAITGNPDATLVCTVNGKSVELPYTFNEYGTITATVRAEGYDEAETVATFHSAYKEQSCIDYTAITADNIASVLGTGWNVGTEATRWAYWSTGDTYYVASTALAGNVSIGGNVMTDEGKYLLMKYGIGRNTTNGETRFWIDSAAKGAIARYDINETRDNSGTLTPYYVCQSASSDLAFALNTNYTLAKARLYEPVSSETGIANHNAEASRQHHNDAIYTLQGIRITRPSQGIYIRNGKKTVTTSTCNQ